MSRLKLNKAEDSESQSKPFIEGQNNFLHNRFRNITPEEEHVISEGVKRVSKPTGVSRKDKLNLGDAYVLLTKEQRDFLDALLANFFKEPNHIVDAIRDSIEVANKRVSK